ncbi:hypothetical protein P9E76_06925 [Schinkia azotoformans]|uniref:Uncharacterized protein n=1 Tax=Schinkia azotoformans LMG 9581 TaxID=1131731 RepID=K6D921_SCHAZ|nr:hypothetical protein [Schinkia azotoformans]EKN64573.1 hypothetical protein BAZO_13219 [Schinkia azotoformans LMG 9581]MEC1637883.1 hypothetical protein [Schinkia azotoformans]MEC1721727.1 hypothetical protein [Schinkia azotoformans]MEC1772077.1 hypothetical protein [Schinkia azotoformans]MEC1944779.1 hypothetical protein [Schinkia azotoformans]
MNTEQMFKELMNEIKGMKEDIKGLKEDNQSIKSQLEENTQLTKAIHHRQEESDAKLENLSMDMHLMRGELSSLKEGQERQDKILESLALRSLEQETELRELKRIK